MAGGREEIILSRKHMCKRDEGYEYTYMDSFINHSCSPNCFYRGDFLVALNPIGEGEELFIDYDTIDWIDEDSFECNCGEKCRGVRQGFYFLSREEQDRLISMGMVDPYLIRKRDEFGINDK